MVKLARVMLVVVLGGACGGGDGTAPVVSNLAIGPLTVTAGMATTISGSMQFMDEDGDVAKIGAAVTFGGMRTEVGPAPVGTTGEDPTVGSVAVAMSLTAPVAGMYALEVWLIDEDGNKSNKLTATVTAQ